MSLRNAVRQLAPTDSSYTIGSRFSPGSARWGPSLLTGPAKDARRMARANADTIPFLQSSESDSKFTRDARVLSLNLALIHSFSNFCRLGMPRFTRALVAEPV
jgi:hypothetical protein